MLSESGATRWGTLPPAVVASEVIAVEHRRWMPAGSGVVFVARVGTADRPLWVCTSFDELADGARDDVAARIEAVGLSVFEAHRLRDDFERMRLMFQSVLDTIPVRVFWKDLEGRYLGSNQLFAEDAAHDSPADLLGKNDYDMPWAPEAELYRADDRAVTKSGDAKVDYEEPQTTPSGTMLWLQTSKIPLRDPEG
ncbi:MAG: PAS domain-containing protein, partial [Myxococcota bacterium]